MQVVCVMMLWATALFELSKVDYVIVLCNNALLATIRTAPHMEGEMPWLEVLCKLLENAGRECVDSCLELKVGL